MCILYFTYVHGINYNYDPDWELTRSFTLVSNAQVIKEHATIEYILMKIITRTIITSQLKVLYFWNAVVLCIVHQAVVYRAIMISSKKNRKRRKRKKAIKSCPR